MLTNFREEFFCIIVVFDKNVHNDKNKIKRTTFQKIKHFKFVVTLMQENDTMLITHVGLK